MTFFELLDTANNGLLAQRHRMNIVSENIANSTTPGYKKKIAIFSQKTEEPFSLVMARELGVKESQIRDFASGKPGKGVIVNKVTEDQAPGQKLYLPGHPKADKNGYVEMSNVDTLTEMLDMMYAVRNYKANLSIVEMVKSAARETLNIGKSGG